METKNIKPVIKNIGPLKGDQYYPETETKNNIFLHHTLGDSAKDAVDWWNQTPERVGTPFIIDRDGTIYQCFDEHKWVFSLGVKGATETEKHGIPIEIVSWGAVDKIGDKYVAYPWFPAKTKTFPIKEEDVIKLDSPYHGFEYFQKYTDAQVTSVISLVKWLVEAYKIPVQKDLMGFYNYQPEVALKNIPGIWSHTTVRTDKVDIFPQPNLIDGLYKAFPIGKVTLLKE